MGRKKTVRAALRASLTRTESPLGCRLRSIRPPGVESSIGQLDSAAFAKSGGEANDSVRLQLTQLMQKDSLPVGAGFHSATFPIMPILMGCFCAHFPLVLSRL